MKNLSLLLLALVGAAGLTACSTYPEPEPRFYGGGVYRDPYYRPYAEYRGGPYYRRGAYGWDGYSAHVADYSFNAAARGMAFRGGRGRW